MGVLDLSILKKHVILEISPKMCLVVTEFQTQIALYILIMKSHHLLKFGL